MRDKKILILGATGTLGTELVKQLLDSGVDSVRAYARNEEKMFWLKKQFDDDRMRFLIGDIRDKDRLNMACRDVDIIINCAAMKHVQICEDSPFEAVKTNIQGTQNAIECAIENNAELFVQISTDKSVKPANLYGATKMVAEKITLEAPNYQGNNKTKFCVVRSGNIMYSSGSCFEIWNRQYCDGQPLTVTDLEATRYMAPKDKIANAILGILPKAQNGLYVLFMPSYKVKDLIKEFPGCKIDAIGLQPGEKMSEELYHEGEDFKGVVVNHW